MKKNNSGMASEISNYRRNLLKLSIFAGVSAPMVSLAGSLGNNMPNISISNPMVKPSLPLIDSRFPAEIAPGVFILTDKRIPFVPNVGIVVGSHSVLVIDCGISPESGENVLEVAKTLAKGKKIILTVTHAHPEHTFGSQSFKGKADIYYNAMQRDYLKSSGSILLDGFYNVLPPEQHYLLKEVKITLPDHVYHENKTTIDLGGREVELKTWGIAHTPGDQIVYLPKEKIVFVGDLIEERMFPIVPYLPPMINKADINIETWEGILKYLIESKPKIIVPGHGNLGGIEIAQSVLDYFTYLKGFVKDNPQTSDVGNQVRTHYPFWENTEYIKPALEYFYTQKG